MPMEPRTRALRTHGIALGAAFLISAAASSLGTSCIILDECILVVTPGTDWCIQAVGAAMWPLGHPELSQPVVGDGNQFPLGCTCVNDAEHEILEGNAPPEQYDDLIAEMITAARNECDYLVPAGWDHNCYVEGPAGPVFPSPNEEDNGSCVGDCAWAAVPKDGCGGDPNPYECELIVNGEPVEPDEETGGSDDGTTGDDPGPVIVREVTR